MIRIDWITSDYLGLPWITRITLDYPDYPGLLGLPWNTRITLDYPGLPWITRITLDYPGLPQITSHLRRLETLF